MLVMQAVLVAVVFAPHSVVQAAALATHVVVVPFVHITFGLAHGVTHVPSVQVCDDVQTVPAEVPVQLPEAPQYLSSVAGSMHFVPHITFGLAHVVDFLSSSLLHPSAVTMLMTAHAKDSLPILLIANMFPSMNLCCHSRARRDITGEYVPYNLTLQAFRTRNVYRWERCRVGT